MNKDSAKSVLEEIFSTSKVHDAEGNAYDLHSHTSLEQCLFLDSIINSLQVEVELSLEIGLAYGISTLQILHSLSKKNRTFMHLVMDPFQQEHWKNVGIHNINRSGKKEFVEFYPHHSDIILPKLLAESRRIDFAYVDSTKVFDNLVVDLHYLIKMLNVGGVVILDDCNYPGIRLLCRMLVNHPALVIHNSFDPDQKTWKGRLTDKLISTAFKSIPFRKKRFPLINVENDDELGVNFRCIAFRKVSEDDRSWNWYKSF